MDAKFLTHFNEIAQDNFIAIAKQNLIFQTQIKCLEDEVNRIPGLLERISELEEMKKEVTGLIEKNADLSNQLNNSELTISNNIKTDTDRHRLQTALNNQAKDLEKLKKQVSKSENKILEQTEYITQLEEMLPNSKKKKLKIAVEVPVITEMGKKEIIKETPKDDVVLTIQSNGGTF